MNRGIGFFDNWTSRILVLFLRFYLGLLFFFKFCSRPCVSNFGLACVFCFVFVEFVCLFVWQFYRFQFGILFFFFSFKYQWQITPANTVCGSHFSFDRNVNVCTIIVTNFIYIHWICDTYLAEIELSRLANAQYTISLTTQIASILFDSLIDSKN